MTSLIVPERGHNSLSFDRSTQKNFSAMVSSSLVVSSLLIASVHGFTPTKPTTVATGPRYFTDGTEEVEKFCLTKPLIQHRESFDHDAWKKGFSTVEREDAYELPDIFPSDLQGTFFQNGHAKFEVGEELVVHPFDADGMLTAVTFEDGKAWFRNRFVETPGFLEELSKSKVCYRGLFGTAKNKGAWYSNIFDLESKNVANTHAMFFNDKLYALWGKLVSTKT
jgi:hypothetical protein